MCSRSYQALKSPSCTGLGSVSVQMQSWPCGCDVLIDCSLRKWIRNGNSVASSGTSVQQENKYGVNKFPYDLLSVDLGARPGLRALTAGADVRAPLVLRVPRFGA